MRGNGKKALTVRAETSRGCGGGRRTLATISADVRRTLESRAQTQVSRPTSRENRYDNHGREHG